VPCSASLQPERIDRPQPPRRGGDSGLPADSYGQEKIMTTLVEVQVARIPDRDRLLEELRDAGLDAHAVDEVGIEVPCDDAEDACDELHTRVEHMVMSLGAPFVPIKHEGVIYIRPPLD